MTTNDDNLKHWSVDKLDLINLKWLRNGQVCYSLLGGAKIHTQGYQLQQKCFFYAETPVQGHLFVLTFHACGEQGSFITDHHWDPTESPFTTCGLLLPRSSLGTLLHRSTSSSRDHPPPPSWSYTKLENDWINKCILLCLGAQVHGWFQQWWSILHSLWYNDKYYLSRMSQGHEMSRDPVHMDRTWSTNNIN